LHITKPPEVFAKLHGLDVQELNGRIADWREKLKAARAKRPLPPRDEKILTAWNGLMIAAMAKGAAVLDNPQFLSSATLAADFVLKELRTRDGRLLRTHSQGQARLMGYLEDYAFFIEGLLNLFEASGESRYLTEARQLAEVSIQYYHDDEKGGFFFTASDAERLIARSKNPQDSAIPSGNSVHAMNLLRLGVLLDRNDYRAKAEGIFRAFGGNVQESPMAYERLCCAADLYHDRVKEIVILGDAQNSGTQGLVRTVYGRYLPNKVVVRASGIVEDPDIPLLKGRKMRDGLPTAFVCENYTCQLPVISAQDLARQLEPQPPKANKPPTRPRP
jgi:uncharacterized protein YyaL (SSP411 family)